MKEPATTLRVSEITPASVKEKRFNIPLYQRLYSWEKEQIIQLLKDLLISFQEDRGKDYYLGTVVLSQAKDQRYDLIDGQQRLTTLWLTGFVFHQYFKEWKHFLLNNNSLRISFAAREEEHKYLNSILYKKENREKIDGINPLIPAAIGLIEKFLISIEETVPLEAFAKYVYERTRLIEVILPQSTDLNKYFEVMNNRGEQLEKHEILKARLLNNLKEKTAISRYACIWDACSQMNQYIEDGFDSKESMLKECIACYDGTEKSLNKIIDNIGNSSDEGDAPHKLIDILESDNSFDTPKIKKDNRENRISSTIGFSVFLLHILSLFKEKKIANIQNKDLLKEAAIIGTEEADEFIKCLLHYRLLYDDYIIKSVFSQDTAKWEIRQLTKVKEEETYRRGNKFRNTAMVQAMLNVSTEAEHWLTPALKHLDKHRPQGDISDESFTCWLESLDNRLAYERVTRNKLIDVAFNYIETGKLEIKPFPINQDILNKGTSTFNYWFFKLDYCLYKKWKEGIPLELKVWTEKIKAFNFRQNRSVEHFFPQYPEHQPYWPEEQLHSFGNLALVSVNSNSSYNNNLPELKSDQFFIRAKKYGLESLKLLIMTETKWTKTSSKEHGDEMHKILSEYHQTIKA